jgi:hypothetical protein
MDNALFSDSRKDFYYGGSFSDSQLDCPVAYGKKTYDHDTYDLLFRKTQIESTIKYIGNVDMDSTELFSTCGIRALANSFRLSSWLYS